MMMVYKKALELLLHIVFLQHNVSIQIWNKLAH